MLGMKGTECGNYSVQDWLDVDLISCIEFQILESSFEREAFLGIVDGFQQDGDRKYSHVSSQEKWKISPND